MARIGTGILPDNSELSLNLDRYQVLMRLPIAAFNGLNKPDEQPKFECSTIWGQSDRDYIATYLLQAQEMREQELGYHLAPRYLVETLPYTNPMILNKKHLISLGERKTADISIGEALVLGTYGSLHTPLVDPVVITIATTLTLTSEIKVYYPGETVEIVPSSVTISSGVLTIKIPRSRLVKPDLNDDRADPLDYYDNNNFLTTVDVKRVYYDLTTAVYYKWDMWQTLEVADATQLAYPRIEDLRLSIFSHAPASYVAGVWGFTGWTRYVPPNWMQVSYLSGRQANVSTEIETVRLSHTLMPNKPTSCPTVHQFWQEDIVVDEGAFMTPYGNRAGAVRAWVSDSRAKVGQGGKFPRVSMGNNRC